ncbi:MAG: family 10 glycosylhydrolase [Candidatus Melainabacteria bacterium]
MIQNYHAKQAGLRAQTPFRPTALLKKAGRGGLILSFLILLVYQMAVPVASGQEAVSAENQAVSAPESGEKSTAPGLDAEYDPFAESSKEGNPALQEKKRVFDYGYLHQKMHVLDDYQARIYDGLELARELNQADHHEEADNLMMEAYTLKSQFESLYYGAQFEDAEKVYDKAFETMVRALSLTTASPRTEGRAIWLDRGSIVDTHNAEGMKALMQKLKNAGINIVYFETINAGFPVYPSKLTRQNPLVAQDHWDPLAVAVEEGHKLGMEVHAWVWCFAVGNRRHNPLIGMSDNYAGPILENPALASEALRGPTGNLLPGGRQYEFWLSPASPKARQFLLDLYKEIVTNYAVDGVQLDYIRYPFQKPNNQMGYEAVGRQQYQAETGRAVGSDLRHWIAWKTYEINSFVKSVSTELKAIRPSLKLSAAVFPMPRAARILAIQQDWETWLDNGWIDTLSPMSYTSSPKKLQRTFDYVNTATQKKAIIYPGIAIHTLDAGGMLTQLDAARKAGALGSTIFAMAHLSDSKQNALAIGPYKEINAFPPHRDPARAMALLLEEYETAFCTIFCKADLMALDRKDRATLEARAFAEAEEKARLEAQRKAEAEAREAARLAREARQRAEDEAARLAALSPEQRAAEEAAASGKLAESNTAAGVALLQPAADLPVQPVAEVHTGLMPQPAADAFLKTAMPGVMPAVKPETVEPKALELASTARLADLVPPVRAQLNDLKAIAAALTNPPTLQLAGNAPAVATALPTVAMLREKMGDLETAAQPWLAHEDVLRPYRAQYFRELQIRLDALMDYLARQQLSDAQRKPDAPLKAMLP